MVRVNNDNTLRDIIKQYRRESFQINMTQKFVSKNKMASDVRLIWNQKMRTISYN